MLNRAYRYLDQAPGPVSSIIVFTLAAIIVGVVLNWGWR